MRTMLHGIGWGGTECEGECPHDLPSLYLRRRASQGQRKQRGGGGGVGLRDLAAVGWTPWPAPLYRISYPEPILC